MVAILTLRIPGFKRRNRFSWSRRGAQRFCDSLTSSDRTGWPVEDEPARRFARTLYGEMIGMRYNVDADRYLKAGTSDLHRAMRQARLEILDTGIHTWAAYQHDGDPFFQLFRKP